MRESSGEEDIRDFEEPAKPLTMSEVPILVHVVCGWPLILVAIGGAIGGGMGGAAYGLSVSVYQKTENIFWTLLCSVVSGAAAVGGWYVLRSR